MKIYGKTFLDVYKQLLWTQKIIIWVGFAFIFFAACYFTYFISTYGLIKKEAGPISLSNKDVLLGTLDPSIVSSADNAYMIYTAITPPTTEKGAPGAEIRLASASRSCDNWSDQKTIFAGKNEDLLGANSLTTVATGTWRTETASIVYDPQDAEAPWKAFGYKYFWDGNPSTSKLYSVITTSTSTNPDGEWTREEWLFSSALTLPPAPYNGFVKTSLNNLHPSLSNILFYSRPSVVEANGVLLMTLSAFTQTRDTPDRVIMIASMNHGKSWRYLGTPLTHDTVTKTEEYKSIGGASLIKKENNLYLAAVFATEKAEGAGTFIIPFQDIMKGLVQLTPDETPLIIKKIPQSSVQPSKIGGGYAGYSDACPQGLFTSEFSDLTKNYRIFKTYHQP